MLHGVKPLFIRVYGMLVTKIVALSVAVLFWVLRRHKSSVYKGLRNLPCQNVSLVALFLKSILYIKTTRGIKRNMGFLSFPL